MFVQKCGLVLTYRTQANMDGTAAVFFTQKFFALHLGEKTSVFLL